MTTDSQGPPEDEMEGRERRLKIAREFANFGTAGEAARKFGWVEPTYRSHENGGRDFKINQAEIYAEAFGVSRDWLYYGRGQPPSRPVSVNAPDADSLPPSNAVVLPESPARPRGRLPVYGVARAGDEGAIVWTREVRDYIDCPGSLEGVPNAYAVYVVGDSMENRYFPGEAVHVNPAKPPRKGDFVVAQVIDRHTGDTVALVKRLVSMDGESLVLAQLNPPKTFTFEMRDVLAVHRIVGTTSE